MSEFFSKLKSAMTRRTAELAIKNAEPLSAIKEKVRNQADLIKKLQTEILIPEKAKARVLAKLSEELQAHFNSPDLALVMLGSASHGGGEIKRHMYPDQELSREIDYGLLSDEALSQQDAEMVHEFVQERMPFIAQDLGLEHASDYHPCGFTNAILVRSLNLESSIDLAKDLTQIITDNQKVVQDGLLEYSDILDETVEQLILYYHPSFPLDVNQRNLRILHDALKKIYTDNPSYWQIIVDELTRQWMIVHRIKDKHLTNKKNWEDTKTHDFVSRVGQESSISMARPFIDLLESTKSSN